MSDKMKTDRELLELAAKSAGYAIEWREWITSRVEAFGAIKHAKHEGFWLDDKQWNPLTDDGDALRLAVKLTLEVDICLSGVAVRTPHGDKILVDDRDEKCIYAATRRAIVVAAAAIGEGMK